jgi:transcriptional regulator of NAD metabolism
MSTGKRRKKVLSILKEARQAVSASALAEQLNVSRQIIVGDIALLRAQGNDILSTPRGYIIESVQIGGVICKLACMHSPELTKDEIYAIVDNGGRLLDVIVEHPLYGQLSGQLNIYSRYDADVFLNKVASGKISLLSNLTDGVHLHTISCSDHETVGRIKNILREMGILYSDK